MATFFLIVDDPVAGPSRPPKVPRGPLLGFSATEEPEDEAAIQMQNVAPFSNLLSMD